MNGLEDFVVELRKSVIVEGPELRDVDIKVEQTQPSSWETRCQPRLRSNPYWMMVGF